MIYKKKKKKKKRNKKKTISLSLLPLSEMSADIPTLCKGRKRDSFIHSQLSFL
jgi:hypothetical protein